MRQANPCQTKPLKARFYTDNWERTTIHIGCVPKANSDITPANPDLRGMALPQDYNAQREFYLTDGNTEYIPPLPRELRSLHLSKNQLRELPTLPNTLESLRIDHNNLSELPKLPTRLLRVDIRNNSLTEIPGPLPATLQRFHVTHNQVGELPSFEDTAVVSVGLGFNSLTALPKFPNTLRRLGCQDNSLTEISGLPDRLELLSCSNNPLQVLNIQNLRFLDMLIASNCGLRILPILPVPHDGNDDDNDDENNDGNWRRNTQNYIFSNNPLEPEFATIYQNFEDDGNAKRFRKAILAEHRRRIAQQKETLGTLTTVFKGPTAPVPVATGATEDEVAALASLGANHGPMNLIASFITGKPGTLEAQRLGLVANQERLRSVPIGTQQQMRERIADIAVGDLALRDDLTDAQKERLKERAKLYVTEGNLDQARGRLPPPKDKSRNEVVVVNNDEENGEAMRVAMGEMVEEAENENEAQLQVMIDELGDLLENEEDEELNEEERRRRIRERARELLNRNNRQEGGKRTVSRKVKRNQKSSKRHTRKH